MFACPKQPSFVNCYQHKFRALVMWIRIYIEITVQFRNSESVRCFESGAGHTCSSSFYSHLPSGSLTCSEIYSRFRARIRHNDCSQSLLRV